MRKLQLCALLLSLLSIDVCLAQANAINIMCDACRDPEEYPEDYANFAFNQIYGPDAWLSFEQADDFFVTNLENRTVYIDVDFVFDGLNMGGIQLPLWPTYLVQITLALPNGDLHKLVRSVFQTSLPVPASPDIEHDDAGNGAWDDGGGGGGGDEGDDDYGDPDAEDYDWDDVEFDGYEGTTSIEDPDENGEFEDPEWCEEC
jgi:hypothetical protein